MCFHPQRSGAAWPNNINTRQAGKHICLPVCQSRPRRQSHIFIRAKKNKNKKTPTLCWNTVVEAKTGTPVKSKLRSRPSLRRQQEEHNNELESQSRVTSQVFFFVVLFCWATSHVWRRTSQLFHMFIKNNNATRREGNLSADISQAQEQRD